MTKSAARSSSVIQRVVALTAAYVLAIQALFSAGAQLRVLLAETPGLCTILGYDEPGKPKHALDACTVHCVGHAAGDSTGLAVTAALIVALTGWTLTQTPTRTMTPRLALAFRGRGPPR